MKNLVAKIALTVLTVVFVMSCAKKEKPSDKGFVLNGTVDKSVKGDSVYIKTMDKKQRKLAKAAVVDGKFTLTGTIDTIQKVFLEGNTQESFSVSFILENETYNAEVKPQTVKIKGGKIHDIVYGFYNSKEYAAPLEEYTKLNDELMSIDMNAEDSKELLAAKNAELNKVAGVLYKIEDENFEKIIADENAPTLAKMFAVVSSQNYDNLNAERRRKLLAEYGKELGNDHPNIKEFIEFMDNESETASMKQTVVNGSIFKPVSGLDVKGKELLLAESVQKNKYTLLEFWASWCGPCRGEVPALKKAYAKYKSKGFEIYGLSTDTDKEAWKQALKEDKTTWPQVLAQNNEAMTLYGVDGIPASFLIDQNGKIVASNNELRGEKLEEVLSKLLK